MEQSAVLLCDFIAEDVSVRSFLAQGSSTRGRKSNRPRQIVEISNRRTGSRGDPAAFDRFNRTRIRPTLAILLGVIAWKRGCRLFFPPLSFSFFLFFSQPSPVPREESSLSLSLSFMRVNFEILHQAGREDRCNGEWALMRSILAAGMEGIHRVVQRAAKFFIRRSLAGVSSLWNFDQAKSRGDISVQRCR